MKAMLIAALALMFGPAMTAVGAPATTEQKCQASKNVAAGEYALCRQLAEEWLVLANDTRQYSNAITACKTRFSDAWQKAEQRAANAGARCPDAPLLFGQFEMAISESANNIATGLDGGGLQSCSLPAPLLKTGQTQCDQGDAAATMGPCPGSPAGQDAALQKGLVRSYTDNGDGTITDNQTGLMWEKLSYDGSIHDFKNYYTWHQAFTKIATLNVGHFAGYNDWRLPNVNELHSLLVYNLPIEFDPVFQTTSCHVGCTVLTCSCNSHGGWTSTTLIQSGPIGDPTGRWAFFVRGDGAVLSADKNDTIPPLSPRAVRGGL